MEFYKRRQLFFLLLNTEMVNFQSLIIISRETLNLMENVVLFITVN